MAVIAVVLVDDVVVVVVVVVGVVVVKQKSYSALVLKFVIGNDESTAECAKRIASKCEIRNRE